MVRARWNGAVIAESEHTVVVDGRHYFPADAVHHEYLVPSDTTSVCGWKGTAGYHSLKVDGALNRDAAWHYEDPSDAASDIAGMIAFWNGVAIDEIDAGSVEDASKEAPGRTFFGRLRHPSAPAGSAVVDADDGTFFAARDGRVTIVDFWAPWCGPCRAFHPMFEQAADGHRSEDISFVRVNVDESPAVAASFAVMTIPTVVVLDAAGREVDRVVGVPGRRGLERLIRRAGRLVPSTGGAA